MLDAAATPRIHTPQRDIGPADDRPVQPSGNRHAAARWHVVYTNPQAERRAVQHLTEQGYAAYLPLVTVRRRDNAIRSLLHRVQIPLFSRYAFVRFDPSRDPWMPIISTLGVRSLLRRPDGTPEPCSDAAISALQASEDARRCQVAGNAEWRVGALVALRRGYAFAGLPAAITSIDGDQATIALMMLGSLRQISVSVECLVARDE